MLQEAQDTSVPLRRAHEELRRVTGFDFHAMGELEIYVVRPREEFFLAEDQRGYHEFFPPPSTRVPSSGPGPCSTSPRPAVRSSTACISTPV